MDEFNFKRVLSPFILMISLSACGGGEAPVSPTASVPDTTAPTITLVGEENVTTEAFEVFEDPGATATDSADGEVTVTVSGEVNTSIPREYILTYSAVDAAGNETSITRNVVVKDTTVPLITLVGEEQVTVEVFEDFQDLGATATDTVDGEVIVTVSGEVNINTIGNYILTYSAIDAAGNDASITRTVVVKDTTAPVLSLLEAGDVVIERGQEYREQGALAEDNYDGETEVTIVSNIDSNVVGSYSVTYSSIDSSGNEETIVRTVSVAPLNVTLTIDQFGEGNITVLEGGSLDCTTGFDCLVRSPESSTVLMEASENVPWLFLSWRGCDDIEDIPENQCSVTLKHDSVVSATFTPNESGYSYQTNNDVVELTEELKNQIVDYNDSTGLITFAREADLSSMQPNTVMVSTGLIGTDGKLTRFFLKRIDEIIGNSGSLKFVRTSEATVTDLIEEGTFVWQKALTAADVDTSSLPQGVTVVNRAVKSSNRARSASASSTSPPIEFLANNLVLYDRDGDVSTKNDQISLTGGFKLFVNPDFALDISFPATLNEFRSIVYVDFNTEAGLDIGGTVSIAERKLAAMNVNFTPIPIGPIILVPAVKLNVLFKADSGMAIKPRIVLTTDIVAGARYRLENGWDGVSDLDFNASVNDWSQTLEVKAQAAIGPEIQYSTSLYGSAGPNVSARGVLGIEALPLTNSEKCILDVNTFLEAAASFGANFKILTKKFDYSTDLIKYKRIISSLSRECGSGKPDAPIELKVTQEGDNALQLDWLAVGDGSETSYKIVRDNVGVETDWLASDYLDEGLVTGQEYCYLVYAKDDMNTESEPSELVCAAIEVPDKAAPSMPTGLVATALSSSAIDLSWESSLDNVGVEGYTVYRIDSGESRAIQNLDATQTDVLRLKASTEYCFAVSSYDSQGNVSELSSQVCASTIDTEQAAWTMLIKCSNRDNYVVEESFDLDEELTEDIFIAGQATDYGGGRMNYSLFGAYNPDTSIFNGEINWSFASSSKLRKDTFSVDLSLSDTGDTSMVQVQNTGCDADIRFTKAEGEGRRSVIPNLRDNVGHVLGSETLSGI